MTFIKKYWITLTGILLGAIAGYFYWLKFACASGTCIITSSPVHSAVYGAVVGGLLFNIFKTKKTNPG